MRVPLTAGHHAKWFTKYTNSKVFFKKNLYEMPLLCQRKPVNAEAKGLIKSVVKKKTEQATVKAGASLHLAL